MYTLDFTKLCLILLMLVIMTSGTLFAAEPNNFGVKLKIESMDTNKQLNVVGYGVHSDDVFNAELVNQYNIGTIKTFGKAIFISHSTRFSTEIFDVTRLNDIKEGMMVEITGKANNGDYIDATHVHVRRLNDQEVQKRRGIFTDDIALVIDEDYQMIRTTTNQVEGSYTQFH